MPDKQSNQSIQHEPAPMPVKNIKITHDMVMAISERVYGMLLRELKMDRERQRLLDRSHRR